MELIGSMAAIIAAMPVIKKFFCNLKERWLRKRFFKKITPCHVLVKQYEVESLSNPLPRHVLIIAGFYLREKSGGLLYSSTETESEEHRQVEKEEWNTLPLHYGQPSPVSRTPVKQTSLAFSYSSGKVSEGPTGQYWVELTGVYNEGMEIARIIFRLR